MAKFDEFWKSLLDGVGGLVTDFAKGTKKIAVGDMQKYLEGRKADIKRWTEMLANDELSRDEFESLLRGMKDAAEIHALQIAGVTLARLQRLRDQLIDMVVNKALGTFLPG